ncbi:transcriptional regulator [Lactococcus hircilactis]|uniref:Transcriptional regulator n=1 Tax=Lactococcus hircilactis TaxID=1494462 RepID=A0A7X1Z6G2_9LACT|nr:TetR/AcrR family transcriptional regulator [Lactococcus hircilactis]MQW38352.1 transcriptional regulator [Lactococcus hircilactis]
MLVITSETQLKIIDAYFRILQEKPDTKIITLDMVAKKVGMRRESIYRYHFKNIEEIRDRIHYLIDGGLEKEAVEFVDGKTFDINSFIANKLLPLLYEKRDWLKVMYSTDIDAEWQSFLLKKYVPIVTNYLELIGEEDIIPNKFLAEVAVKEILALISTWLTDEQPEPASLFKEKFLCVFQYSPYGILTNSNHK